MPMKWYILPLNPEPWAIGPVTVGRQRGRYTGNVGRNQQLAAFQQAVKDEIGHVEPMIQGHIKLRFFFWRNRAEYTTSSSRAHRKHEADVTNLQKALEDALQGILYVNDKNVNDIQSVLVEQGPSVAGRILIGIDHSPEMPEGIFDIPPDIMRALETLDNLSASPDSLAWGAGDVF
jgi:Holliday junction resolvase RusA-like endonuclease